MRTNELLDRKARGAFFTPPAIADFLASWAVDNNPHAKVLDPTCGEAVFLLAAGNHLRKMGSKSSDLTNQLFGVDIDEGSLEKSAAILRSEEMSATLQKIDFFSVPSPDQIGCPLPRFDAVVGNPPFVRYQMHTGATRQLSSAAALRQGVRLNGLASSWAALVIHACSFLTPEGRLAMVLPAELLSVNYAEPVRRWLRTRFAAVHLVVLENLQFEGALEKVVLVLAQGSGGCDAFSLWHVDDATDLKGIRPFDPYAVTPTDDGKWTDLFLSIRQRQLFRRVSEDAFVSLGEYGNPELGSVTGANSFFALNESTREKYSIPESDLLPISPPGTKHLKGMTFTKADWMRLRNSDERVWLLRPDANSRSPGLKRYIAEGERLGVHEAYKCTIRDPWWRPPTVSPPDLFFTYMSHRFPRLIRNAAKVSFLNSMHGIRVREGLPNQIKTALPLLSLNSISMLGAEVFGRSYGGGVLKMEPREAARLPVPSLDAIDAAWALMKRERGYLDRQLRQGRWTGVLAHVDDVLLKRILGLSGGEVTELHEAARNLRERRIGEDRNGDSSRDRGESGASGRALGLPERARSS